MFHQCHVPTVHIEEEGSRVGREGREGEREAEQFTNRPNPVPVHTTIACHIFNCQTDQTCYDACLVWQGRVCGGDETVRDENGEWVSPGQDRWQVRWGEGNMLVGRRVCQVGRRGEGQGVGRVRMKGRGSKQGVGEPDP